MHHPREKFSLADGSESKNCCREEAERITVKKANVKARKEKAMIEFATSKIGDKVTVVGAGAPGFAKLGEVLSITKVAHDRVWAKRETGEEAFFALTCGAARLDPVGHNVESTPK